MPALIRCLGGVLENYEQLLGGRSVKSGDGLVIIERRAALNRLTGGPTSEVRGAPIMIYLCRLTQTALQVELSAGPMNLYPGVATDDGEDHPHWNRLFAHAVARREPRSIAFTNCTCWLERRA